MLSNQFDSFQALQKSINQRNKQLSIIADFPSNPHLPTPDTLEKVHSLVVMCINIGVFHVIYILFPAAIVVYAIISFAWPN